MMISGSYSDVPPLAYISTLTEGGCPGYGNNGSIFPLETETCYGLPVTLTYEAHSNCVDAPLTMLANELSVILNDEDEDAPPTPYAINQSILVCTVPSQLLSHNWRKPRIATDGYGGIRLSWKSGKRELRAVVAGSQDRDRYLYWEDESGYGSISNFTAVTLFTYLDALVANRPFPTPGN
jgi:hypothetical protein